MKLKIKCVIHVYVDTAYVGPYNSDPGSPDSIVTKIQVLNVTPDASKTDDTESDSEIPTLNFGKLHC